MFQDGIFVTQTESQLPEGARQCVIGRINLNGEDECALRLDRRHLADITRIKFFAQHR